MTMPMLDTGTMNCAPNAHIVEATKNAGYERKFTDVIDPQLAMSIYVDKAGEWILTFNTPDGINCLIATGHNWYGVGKDASK